MAEGTRAAQAESDSALVARAAEGEGRAFEELVLRYQDRVYGIALRLTRRPEDAEDVTQEAFVKAYEALPLFRGRSSFYTWLFRIAFNTAHSRLRSLGRRHAREKVLPMNPADPDDEAAPLEAVAADPDPVEAAEISETARVVASAVDALDADHRAVVVLRDIEGLSYEEIAEVVGSTRAAVKSRIHRARRELAVGLKGLM